MWIKESRSTLEEEYQEEKGIKQDEVDKTDVLHAFSLLEADADSARSTWGCYHFRK